MQEEQRDPLLVAVHDEAGALVGAVVVDDARHVHRPGGSGLAAGHRPLGQLPLVRDDAAGESADPGVPADDAAPELAAVFVEALRIDDAGEQVAHVVLAAGPAPEDLEEVAPGSGRFAGGDGRRRLASSALDRGHQPADAIERGRIVGLAEVDRPGDLRVHERAAELLARDLLPDRGLHERRPGEIEPASLGHHKRVAEDRQVSAARDAVAHDRGELRDPLRRDHRVVAEDATEVVGVGKDVLLQRQVDARAVDEVDQRHLRPLGDRLSADDLLAGHRKERAGLHGGVVGDDHRGPSLDRAQGGHDARGRGPAVLAVHPVGGEEPAFEPGRSGVEQVFEAFPGGEASVPVLPLDALGATALLESGGLLEQVRPGLGKGRGGEIDGRPGLAHERARILPPRHRVRRAPPQPTSRSRSDPGREGWTASFARL